MHWTTDRWQCLYCRAAVGQLHAEGCAVAQTTAAPVWLGPPITPGMVPRLVAEGDVIAGFLSCSHCEEPFEAGEVIFENRAQSLGIHGTCILLLAQSVPRELMSPDEVDEEYERRLAEIDEP